MDIQRNSLFPDLWDKVKIELLEAGMARLGTEWRARDVCSPYSRLYYVISGNGTVRLPGEEPKQLRPGRIYLIPNGLDYDYCCEEKLEKLYFHINVRMLDGFDLFRGCRKCCEIEAGAERIARAGELYRSRRPQDYFLLRGEIYLALSQFVEIAGVSEKMGRCYSPLLTQLFSLTRRSISQGVTVKWLAGNLHVSESTLAKQFKKETGMTLGNYMEQRIMGKARQLLVSSDASLGEISEELGFCDQFYFSRYFKARQGATPSVYRKWYADRKQYP